jgi:cell division protein FtsB
MIILQKFYKDKIMPISIILELLKGNWKLILGAVLVAGTIFYVQSLRLEIANKALEIQKLTTDNAVLTENNSRLKEAIIISNKSLDLSDKAAKKAKADVDVVKGRMLQQTNDLKQRLADILNQKEPATCNESIVFLLSNVKGYQK